MSSPVSVFIRLSYQELALAAMVGVFRRISAMQKARSAVYGEPTLSLWEIDIESSAAEMALAKHLGVYWLPLALAPREIVADVGREDQSRSTGRPDGSLLIHHRDLDEQRFWLVITCKSPVYEIVGWVYASEGKRDEYWRTVNGRSAFYVPQSILRDPDVEMAA